MSWIALALACLLIPHRWQEKSTQVREGSLRAKWARLWMGGIAWRKKFRVKALARNPFYWLTSRERWNRPLVWIVFVVIAGVWWLGWREDRLNWFVTSTYVTTSLFVGCFLKMWVASTASRRLGADRRMNALELVLTTPMTETMLIAGQWRSLRRMFLWPGLFFVAALIVFAIQDFRHKEEIWKWVAGLAVFVADVLTLGWLAMWLSLRLARPHRAMMLACLLVLALPWLIFGLGSLAMGVVLEALRQMNVNAVSLFARLIAPENIYLFFLGFWAVTCLAMDAAFLVWSRHHLRKYFRLLAVTPVGVRPDFKSVQ